MSKIISNFKCYWILSKKEFYQILAEDGLLSIVYFIIYFIGLIFAFIWLLIKLLFYPLVLVHNKFKKRFETKYIAMFGKS